MGDLWLFLIDVVVLAWLISTYVRLRRLLAGMAASISQDTATDDEGDGSGTGTRVTGVVRAGRLMAMFTVIEVDVERLSIRSRPGWLGLAVVVPRRDVAAARVATDKAGRPTSFDFVPVAEHAVGLERLRIRVRRDPVELRRRLRRMGWLSGDPTSSAAPVDPDASLGSAG